MNLYQGYTKKAYTSFHSSFEDAVDVIEELLLSSSFERLTGMVDNFDLFETRYPSTLLDNASIGYAAIFNCQRKRSDSLYQSCFLITLVFKDIGPITTILDVIIRDHPYFIEANYENDLSNESKLECSNQFWEFINMVHGESEAPF